MSFVEKAEEGERQQLREEGSASTALAQNALAHAHHFDWILYSYLCSSALRRHVHDCRCCRSARAAVDRVLGSCPDCLHLCTTRCPYISIYRPISAT